MLNKLLIPVDFAGGLDNKTDEKLVLPSRFTTLENALFDGSTVNKGGGYTALALTARDASATAVAATVRSLNTRKDELLLEANGKLHAVLDSSAGGQVPRTTRFIRTAVGIGDVISSERDQTEFDAAYSGAYSCYAWVENGNVRYTIVNEGTGAAVVHGSLVTSAGRPRVVYDSSAAKFYIYVITSGGNLAVYAITAATPGAAPAATTIYTDAQGGTNARMDAVYSAASNVVFVAYRLAAGGFKVGRLTSGNTSAATRTIAAYTPGAIGIQQFRLSAPVCIAVCNTAGTSVDAYTMPDDLSADATGVVSSPAACYRVTLGAQTDGQMRIFWEEGGVTAGPTRLIRRATVNDAASVTDAAQDVRRSVAIASKPFLYNDELYLTAVLMSDYQPTLFIINTEGQLSLDTQKGVVARILAATAGRYRSTWDATTHIPAPMASLRESDSFSIPVLRRGALRLVNGADVTPSGVARADVYFGRSSRPLQDVEHENFVFFTGGCPMYYDGQNVAEAGFHSYPDPIDFGVTDAGGGTLPAGVYGVALVWEYTDAIGRRHQSAPAIAEAVTVAPSGTLRVVCPTDRLTRHDSLNGITRLVVYRTEADGTIFYRDTPSAGSPINDFTVDSVVLDFTTAAATLIQNEPIYTTGSVLDNQTIPACRVACVHQERLVIGALEDPYAVRYFEQLRPGHGPATNGVYELRVPSDFGEVTGLASMDDKLVVFAERGAWFFYGEGMNRLGSLDAFSLAQVAVPDIGCKMASPKSICRTPDGVWFRSAAGLRLLTRGLQLARDQQTGEFLGAEVDSSVDGCVAALQFGTRSEVWFYTGTIVLVFNYRRGQWSKLTNHTAVDAVAWRSTHAHVTNTPALFYATGVTHNGTAINVKAETAWIKLAGVQGYQRVWEAHLLGTYVGSTTLRLEVGYDYETAYTTPTQVDTGAVFGSSAIPLQIRHQFAKQKCEAIRFRISETNAAGNAGFSLTNLTLSAGVKRGGFKIAGAKTVG